MATQKDPVKTYQWDPSSLISRVDMRPQGKEGYVAYIHASPTEEENLSQLRTLHELFLKKGWATSSDTRNGEAVLRLTGLKNESDLVDLLQSDKYTSGQPSVSYEKQKPQSALDKVKSNSLQASGIFYTLGNSLYVLSGIKRGKDWGQMGTGISFASGDLLLALVGKKDDKRQFASLLGGLKNHLEADGIDIPHDSAIIAETKSNDKAGVYGFLRENINKFKAGAEVLGGFMYFWAGHKQKNRWKQATAVIFTTGFGSTLFIKEKKPDKEKLANAGPLQKAWAFVQEKPLRIAGWSGLSNTLFTTIGAFQEKKKSPGTSFYKYDLATASSMFVANNLYAMSNKHPGGSITEEGLIRDVYGIAAQVINRAPEQQREAAINATVNFLGERTEIKDSREQIDANLREQLNRSSQNPWFRAKSEELAQSSHEAESRWEKLAQTPASKEGRWTESAESSRVHGLSAAR